MLASFTSGQVGPHPKPNRKPTIDSICYGYALVLAGNAIRPVIEPCDATKNVFSRDHGGFLSKDPDVSFNRCFSAFVTR